MVSIAKLKKQIEAANAIGLENLEKKGVSVMGSPGAVGIEPPTTMQIMMAIDLIEPDTIGGREAERRAFWDAFTNNNTNKDYTSAFQNSVSARMWNKSTFNPPYKLNPVDCNYMFEYFGHYNDLAPMTPEIVDFTGCTTATKTFSNACMSPIEVDFSNLTSMRYTFESSNGGNMPNTTIKVSKKLSDATNAFMHNVYGAKFTDDSVIACSVSFAQSSLLSAESLQSIISALDYVDTACTLTLHPYIALTEAQKSTIESKGWTLVQ